MILLESPDGSEKKLVESMDGAPHGWKVLADNVRAPLAEEDWDPVAKRWKINAQRKAQLERAARARDPHQLLAMIEALEARVALLEGVSG